MNEHAHTYSPKGSIGKDLLGKIVRITSHSGMTRLQSGTLNANGFEVGHNVIVTEYHNVPGQPDFYVVQTYRGTSAVFSRGHFVEVAPWARLTDSPEMTGRGDYHHPNILFIDEAHQMAAGKPRPASVEGALSTLDSLYDDIDEDRAFFAGMEINTNKPVDGFVLEEYRFQVRRPV